MGLRGLYGSIVSVHPLVETITRKIYWNSDFLIKKKREKKREVLSGNKYPFSEIMKRIGEFGITKNDLLIVHSGYGQIYKNCSDQITPQIIIDSLINMIGPFGTIAFPTHPAYPQKKISKLTMRDNDDKEEPVEYNVITTKAWTGLLPNYFLKYPNVVRSRHPINTMAALGPLAIPMMEKNIDSEKPLACGHNSSWRFCAEKRAKLLGFGVDLVHSLTMIHVAEDSNPNWPIDGWYRDRVFTIIDGDFQKTLKVRERKPKWAIYYAERCFRRDLIRDNVLRVISLGDLTLEYIDDSGKLIEYLNSKNRKGYPYYIRKWL